MGTLTLILDFDNLNTILSLHYCPLTDNVIFVSYYSPYFVIFFSFSVGSAIPVERTENPSVEQINELHSEYVKKLKGLFDKHRDACGVPRDTELVIQ